ncbi:MAG: glycosyltransferase family 4 protein [Chloroflexota bacterium]
MSLNLVADRYSICNTDCTETSKSGSLRVLHVDNIIGETSASLNEHVLPMVDEYNISLCTFFPSPVNVPSSINLYAGEGTIISFYRNLWACLRANEYDVVHIHAPHVGLFALIFILFWRIKLLKSTIYTVHCSYQFFTRLHRLLLIFLFLSFRRIVHCSWSSYDSFPLLYRLLGGSRRTVIPNGVDVSRVDRAISDSVGQRLHSIVNDKLRVLSVGRLIPVKNLFTLMEVVANTKLPNITLEFLGDGELRDSLCSSINQSDLSDQIVLRGMIPRDQVYHELANADLYISTSLGEGLPIAVMEAMCCRCPVILSDIPPHRELAELVDFIPLIDPKDSARFSYEIQRILNMSQVERAKLGEKGRQLVEKHFSLKAMHEGYAALYTYV